MEMLNPELQLQPGEVDTAKGLLALNAAQDQFEAYAASIGKFFQSTKGNVTTSASTETTAFPSGVLRIDRLQTISATTSRPDGELVRLHRTGGHAMSSLWPFNLTLANGTGKPRAYWTDGSLIYWNPLPDATYTVRYYGWAAGTAITAGGTFVYPDIVAMPLAAYACRLVKIGLDDPSGEIAGLAAETFGNVIKALGNFNRDGAVALEYTREHLT